MKTILYLGVDARSAAFAAAVVGRAARDETVNVYDPEVGRAGDINLYGLHDIPCMARIGTITEARLKKTYDMMVALKLLDPAKVDHRKTFTTEFIKDVKVMP
jgi:hypothetical protein